MTELLNWKSCEKYRKKSINLAQSISLSLESVATTLHRALARPQKADVVDEEGSTR